MTPDITEGAPIPYRNFYLALGELDEPSGGGQWGGEVGWYF